MPHTIYIKHSHQRPHTQALMDIHTYTHLYTDTPTHRHTYAYISTHLCIHLHTPIHRHLCIHLHTPIHRHTYAYISTHLCIHLHTPMHTPTHTYTQTHLCIHLHTPIHRHTYAYTYTHLYTDTPMHIRTHIANALTYTLALSNLYQNWKVTLQGYFGSQDKYYFTIIIKNIFATGQISAECHNARKCWVASSSLANGKPCWQNVCYSSYLRRSLLATACSDNRSLATRMVAAKDGCC